MQEFILDTANIKEIERGIRVFPVSGITTNPSILKKEGRIDVFEHLKKVRQAAGDLPIHVQVVSSTEEERIREAEKITAVLGKDVYIKVPADKEGIPVIRRLKADGYRVTATVVYTEMQGIFSALSGADYIAVYVNRMENLGMDPMEVIRRLRCFIDEGGHASKILAASFHTVRQIGDSYAAGAHAVTVSPSVAYASVDLSPVNDAVRAFTDDFLAITGGAADHDD